jgi:hypothetical protein
VNQSLAVLPDFWGYFWCAAQMPNPNGGQSFA